MPSRRSQIAVPVCPRIKQPKTHGELRILAKAENVSLNGNFEVTVSLTKNEIARLAAAAFAEDSFSDVLDALSRGTPLKTPNSKMSDF